MKTTIDIADPLFHELKRRAAQERTTIRRLIDAALRTFLSGGGNKPHRFKLKDGSVGGRGVAPGIREGDWAQIRDLIYEGRGLIAVDSNILVYAHRKDSEWHAAAAEVLDNLANGSRQWLIPWPCAHEFLAIVTHPRIYSPPSSGPEAIRQFEYWMESPSLVVAGESAQHWQTLREHSVSAKASGPLWHDARIAAICLDHGVEALWTADRDFSRFAALKTANPLARRRR